MAGGGSALKMAGSLVSSHACVSETLLGSIRLNARELYDGKNPGVGKLRVENARLPCAVSVAEAAPASWLASEPVDTKRRRRRGSNQRRAGQVTADREETTKVAVGVFVEADRDVPLGMVDTESSLDVIRETLNGMFASSSEVLQSTQTSQGPACAIPWPSDHEHEKALNMPQRSSEGRTLLRRNEVPGEKDELWLRIREEAREDSEAEPALASFLYSTILAHRSLERALAFHIGNKLSSSTLLSTQLFTLISDTLLEDAYIRKAIRADIMAVKDRDPACISYSHCILNFKGFQALQAHRVAHRLWMQGRYSLALAIQSRVSEVFHVDFHPAAKIGKGVLFDHATGVVVGETATIGDNVSILHHVTLGGTGALGGDRHPKVGDGVLIGAGATILGPITIGEGAKIGAGSVVLMDIPAHCTAVGNPARLVGGKEHPAKLTDIPSKSMDHTLGEWADYVI